MPAFLTKDEEREIRSVLDQMAQEYGLSTKSHEPRFEGFYPDRIWNTKLGSEEVAVVAFEIERGVPSNERWRKDIFNLAASRAPLGFIIVPHQRILGATQSSVHGQTAWAWVKWYRSHGRKDFEIYSRPFPYTSIRVLDADTLVAKRSLSEARVWLTRVQLRKAPASRV